MRWLALVWILGGASACSLVLGLQPAPAADLDGDRVPDSVDNCPTVFNPDQSNSNDSDEAEGMKVGDACDVCNHPNGVDSDGDGIDNACDGCDNRLPDEDLDGIPDACEGHFGPIGACPGCMPCALGPAHDEDGDMIADACDPCPATYDPFDADSDNDHIGDACDLAGASYDLQFFDPFSQRNQLWYETGPWTIAGDAARTSLAGGAGTRMAGSANRAFILRTRAQITLDPTAELSGQTRAALLAWNAPDKDSSTFLAECYVDASGTLTASYASTLGATPLPVVGAGVVRVDMPFDLSMQRTNAGAMTCIATGSMPGADVVTASQGATGVPRMFAGVGGEGYGDVTFFDYDLVTNY